MFDYRIVEFPAIFFHVWTSARRDALERQFISSANDIVAPCANGRRPQEGYGFVIPLPVVTGQTLITLGAPGIRAKYVYVTVEEAKPLSPNKVLANDDKVALSMYRAHDSFALQLASSRHSS